MRKRIAVYFAVGLVSIFGAAACGGGEKEQQPAKEETMEETTVAQPTGETKMMEKKEMEVEIGTPYEDLPEEVKATMPEEVKQKIKEEQKQ